MSYILDAINKSERERTDQQAAPLNQTVEVKDTLTLSDRWVASWWVAAGLLGLLITVVGVFWPTEPPPEPAKVVVQQQIHQPPKTKIMKSRSPKTQPANAQQIKQIYQGSTSSQSVANRQQMPDVAKILPASVAIASLYDKPGYDKPGHDKSGDEPDKGSEAPMQVYPAQASEPVLTASELNTIQSDFETNELHRQKQEDRIGRGNNNPPVVDAETTAFLAAPKKALQSTSHDVRVKIKPAASMLDARRAGQALINEVPNEEPNEVPMVDELPLNLQRMIPDIDFSAHVYSGNKNGGFVILNGSMRSPGDRIAKNLYVDKILESAVVMRLGKSRFKLKSMTSWYAPAID